MTQTCDDSECSPLDMVHFASDHISWVSAFHLVRPETVSPTLQAALERATGLGCCDVLRLIVRILGFIVSSILIDMFGEFCCGNDFFPEFFFCLFCVWSSIELMWRLIQDFSKEQLSDRILNVKSLLFHYIFFSPPSSLVFYLY